jgi:hypothetical protein
MKLSPSPELVPDHIFSAFNFNGVIHPLPVLPVKSNSKCRAYDDLGIRH